MKHVYIRTVLAVAFTLVFALVSAPMVAQEKVVVESTGKAQVFAGPSRNTAVVSQLQPNVQLIIIPPKSVFIGKGVVIGKGVLIEGKPWHQVQLPTGETGYVTGSMLCLRNGYVEGTLGACLGN
ncbi:MAG: hypothetical protein AAF468_08900 [Pseudomonadota bacterium]